MKIEIFEDIDKGWFVGDNVFGLKELKSLIEGSEDKDVRIDIHCNGGSCAEGLAMYDYLRSSGKDITTHIDGECHSIALVVLLAAPKERRFAAPNARGIIHHVRGFMGFDAMTADELKAAAEGVAADEERILNIYAERTGTDIETLRKVMGEEKERSAQELKDLGFVGEIDTYTTNKKDKSMKIFNLIKRKMKKTNYEFKDEEGKLLFSSEKETAELAVGDAIVIADGSDSGEFILEDGRKVVVDGGVIATIEEPKTEEEETETEKAEEEADVDALKADIDTLKAEVETLKAEVETLKAALEEVKIAQQKSNYIAPKRVNQSGKVGISDFAEKFKKFSK